MVSRRCGLPGLSGAAEVARRVHLPGVLSLWWVADGEGALDVHRVWLAELRALA